MQAMKTAIAFFFCILSLQATAFAESLQVDLSGKIELRGTYDTNVFLTTDDEDFELREHPRDDTEQDDFYGNLKGNVNLDFNVTPYLNKSLRYYFDLERYSDLDNEHNEKHRLEFEPVIQLSRDVQLSFIGLVEGENRRPNAEYRRPDYLEYQLGTALQWQAADNDQLTLSLRYEDRDYDSLTGTSFDDYDGTWVELGLKHRFHRQVYTHHQLRYRWRDYDESTRDEFGIILAGRDRSEDRLEIENSLTWLPGKNTLLRFGHLYRNNQAPASFYDYELNRLIGIYVQRFPWELQLQTYAHYQWRDYDDQLAQDIITNPITGDTSQVFSDDERSDRQFFLLLNLTKRITSSVSCGLEFQHWNNESNDDSSEYASQRYSVFIRYRF
jgi:hypothetical protein